MKGALERFAWRMWRGEAGLGGRVVGTLLLPLEALWRVAARARNRRYDGQAAATVEGLPVVSVGNVVVGGTGKTPFSAWVASTLHDAGLRPCVLLRGYGTDETELHRVWNPHVPVEVDADRVRAAERARARGCDVAVLDDGFQHRALHRVLDVVLVAAEDPMPGAVLPRGPYREPLTALRRADVVVVTRRSAGAEAAEALASGLRTHGAVREEATLAAVHLAAADVVGLPEWVTGAVGEGGAGRRWDGSGGVVALTAVARADAFRADVAAVCDGADVELVAHPDHHDFGAADARHARSRAGDRPIFITEKDAVKLGAFQDVLGDAWVLRQRLAWDRGEDEVRRRLEAVSGERRGGRT